MKGTLSWVAVVLVIIGALNWGLVGLLGIDLVNVIFGEMRVLARIVYGIIGLAGIYDIYLVAKK
jgi:hypothetical protein